MPVPVPADILASFKAHERIEHARDDVLITEVYLPAAIAKVIRTTDLRDGTGVPPDDQDDWIDGLALNAVYRIAGAMYEARETNIDIQPTNSELIALWRPSA